MGDLTVCSKCGWHNGYTHASECDPKRAATRDAFVAKLAGVEISTLGYGFGRIAVHLGQSGELAAAALVFGIGRGTINVMGIFWFEPLSPTKMAALVHGINAILGAK